MTNSHKPSPASPPRREPDIVVEPLNGTHSGVRFFMDNEAEMVEIRLDANSVIGPRRVTEGDKVDHSGEYASFLRSLEPEPAEQPDQPSEPPHVQQHRKPGRPRKAE